MAVRVSPTALLWLSWLPAVVCPAGPADPRPRDAVPQALAGRWARAGEIDRMLAFKLPESVPAALELTLDAQPGARWGEEQAREIRAELGRLRHRLIATARAREGEKAREWAITHHDGGTYGCVVVPNLGVVAFRLSLIPGATSDRDLLFIEWPDPARNARVVSAYKREPR